MSVVRMRARYLRLNVAGTNVPRGAAMPRPAEEMEECPVCMEHLVGDLKCVITLPCGHCYHTKCTLYRGCVVVEGTVMKYRCDSRCPLCCREHTVSLRVTQH